MAKPFRLQTLVTLAHDRSEAAAQALARLRHAWQDAESKLGQLQVYLDEYRRRLQQQTESGFTIAQWRDYQAFIAKLEMAIESQVDEVERCRQRWLAGQSEWQEREREVKAYEALRSRHELAERKHEERQDQRTQDEFASNAHRRQSSDTE